MVTPYVEVAIARPLGGTWTYAVPALLRGHVVLGSVVLVPLGRRGGETGYIVATNAIPTIDLARIKPISRLLDPVPAFDAEQLDFFHWVADYYLAPLGLVIQTALPSGLKARVVSVLEPTEDAADALGGRLLGVIEAQVLREVVSRPGLTPRTLCKRLAAEVNASAVTKAVGVLLQEGLLQRAERETGAVRGQVRTAELMVPAEQALAQLAPRARRMRALVDALAGASGAVDVPDLVRTLGSSTTAALRRLSKQRFVQLGSREKRDVLLSAPALGARTAPPLNSDQRAALEVLCAPQARGPHLLFGVTGSGKTEVFLGAAQHVLASGRQVVVLVPEIGLTPQLVGRFRARFGDTIAVLHSGLTGAERLGQWRRIRAGEAAIAIGARSALFAPFADLGLIVVDEEHDDSYKQDDGVRYNARDLAVVLGHKRRCPVILATATPSLESWLNAKRGRYPLLRLPKRATPRPVPKITLVDMSQLEVPKGSERPILSNTVIDALRATFDRGGKAIVLYNRRGYATMVECQSCGGTYECPNCGVTLTLHRRASTMSCHYCGLKRPYTSRCPVCKDDALDEVGKGTERVEEALATLFPDISQVRMDADTTAVRGAHERILSAFRDGDARLLVGTQIVAKGHDFPDVHTAVVVSADRGFRMPDFRAAERTYALLVQLAGRAGRGDHPGEVYVQTWDPSHYVLRHLDQTETYLDRELRLRATLRYPPWSRLTLVRLEATDRRKTEAAAHSLAQALRAEARSFAGVGVLGPAPAALPRLVGRWRFQIILRGEQDGPWRAFLRQQREALHKASRQGVRVSWDVDPRSLM